MSAMPAVLGSRHELQGHAVVAVALAGGLGTVIENVALMAAAAGAVVLGARIDQLEVGSVATASGRGCQKLGQPVPLSYFVELSKSGR
jgi:hypothetical protein